ncbi:hypothetical protein ALQ88_200115 [Pseudomonas savastanoi]|nr:hypothetical protein ALQ88_200115 [Pseudomonas savastanoi]
MFLKGLPGFLKGRKPALCISRVHGLAQVVGVVERGQPHCGVVGVQPLAHGLGHQECIDPHLGIGRAQVLPDTLGHCQVHYRGRQQRQPVLEGAAQLHLQLHRLVTLLHHHFPAEFPHGTHGVEQLALDAKLRVTLSLGVFVGQPDGRNHLLNDRRSILRRQRLLGVLGVHDQDFPAHASALQNLLDGVCRTLEGQRCPVLGHHIQQQVAGAGFVHFALHVEQRVQKRLHDLGVFLGIIVFE